MKTTFYIKRFFTTFTGRVDHVDYVGPYCADQDYALQAQYRTDMNRQKPAEVQATYYEWVEMDCDTKDETVLSTAGYKTRSFAA
tara:strand:- start:261 stop:512 length:252 start_codon:yes stop_codon:yes gene_type:complete